MSKLLNLNHPYPRCCLSMYFTVFRLGETAGPLLALLPLFPKYYMVLGMGIIATLPLSGDQFLLMSIESSRTHWFFGSSFQKNHHQIYFHLESRKEVQCLCPVQARLEIPNNLLRELLISNCNKFWICKPSSGSP